MYYAGRMKSIVLISCIRSRLRRRLMKREVYIHKGREYVCLIQRQTAIPNNRIRRGKIEVNIMWNKYKRPRIGFPKLQNMANSVTALTLSQNQCQPKCCALAPDGPVELRMDRSHACRPRFVISKYLKHEIIQTTYSRCVSMSLYKMFHLFLLYAHKAADGVITYSL